MCQKGFLVAESLNFAESVPIKRRLCIFHHNINIPYKIHQKLRYFYCKWQNALPLPELKYFLILSFQKIYFTKFRNEFNYEKPRSIKIQLFSIKKLK